MRPLRVLTVGHSYVVATNRCEMDRMARHDGVEVTVAAPSFWHGDLRSLDLEQSASPPYRLVGLPAVNTRQVHTFFYRGLRQVLREQRFDLLYAWEEPYIVSGFQAAFAARKAGIPFVFRTAQNLSKRYPWPFSRFERYSLQTASAWIATGELIARAMVGRGYPQETMTVLPHGTDEAVFHPDEASRAKTRRELGLEGVVVGYLGRLVPEKGLDLLMEALPRVREPWTFLAVGSGPYKAQLLGWARERGLGDRVKVAFAKHGEVPAYLRAMDMLVAPSQTTPKWKEQLGRMLVEAFACGVPVIGSDSGEIPYVIADAGIVVGEKDVDGWARAIGDLARSSERRDALRAQGLARFHAAFSAKYVADAYVGLFRRVVADRARSTS